MYSNIKVKGQISSVPSETEVDELEAKLASSFPVGYRDYITSFGSGVLGGSYIRIFTPAEILTGEVNLYEWRKRIDKYWFWDKGEVILTKEKAQECIIIGDTLDGDEICFHPESKDKIYILPRYEEQVFIAGMDLPESIEWLCSSGVLTEAFTERFLEPNE